MAENPNGLDFACDWVAGFNLNPNFKGCIGYLLSWSGCGGMNLKSDIEVWCPMTASHRTVVTDQRVKCIALLESLSYAGGENDPIRIAGYVSKDMAAEIRGRLTRPLTNTTLKLSWYIINYDGDRKAWYEAGFVRDNKKADANIDSAGGMLQIFINKVPSRVGDTLDLNVFRFEFQVVPAENKVTVLEFATGQTQRLVKQWGEQE